MDPSTKIEDKMEGIENFQAWKYRIDLIIIENDLDKYIKDEVTEPEEGEAKEKHQKNLIKAMRIALRIIADYIKDHLIPQVPSKETPNKMYDSLSRMYEGRNMNIKMNLRAQLNSTKMSKGESIQDYLTRVS